jgi:ligand-binding sensor domain-containing protein
MERRADSRIRSTDIFDIVRWSGLVWFATNDGLLSYEEKRREWTRYDVQKNLFANEVRALAAVDSELWIGTVRGLQVMTPGRVIWRINNPGIELSGVTDIAQGRDTIYVGTQNGLFKGSRLTREFSFGRLDPGLLNAPIHENTTTATEVWIATPDGIMRAEPGTGATKSWLAADWFGNQEPTTVQANERYVWVGTNGGGFYRYRKDTGEWLSYTRADGLVSNNIQIIRIDGNDLLLGTPDGLTRYVWNRPGQLR